MKLDIKDELVIDDAARLAKSTFVSLYTKLGYEEMEVGAAWHNIRRTPTGHRIMLHYGVGQPSKSYEIDKEVKRRKEDMKSRHIKPVNVTKQLVAGKIEEPKEELEAFGNADADFDANDVNEKVLTGGSKEETAKNLIASGITKAKELSVKGEFSLPYAYQMLKKYGAGKKS